MNSGNIILYHTGTIIPEHLIDCIQKIRHFSSIPIYLLTDQLCTIENINVIDLKKYDNLKWLDDLNYFIQDEYKILWRSSCFRFFYIQQFLEETNLNHNLHFDNDVLLYETPEIIVEKIIFLNKPFMVTAHNEEEIVMGMSYMQNANSLNAITSFIKSELEKGFAYLQTRYTEWPNEMQIISKSSSYNTLPILPPSVATERYSNFYNNFKSIFDPSSYGQYFGGTFKNHQAGWFGTHQEIGKHLASKKISLIMDNKNPYLIYNDQKIKINNLHIHSKQTKNFL